VRELAGVLAELIKNKTYHCCIAMLVAKSFTGHAYKQETKSPHPVKLSVVNEQENIINIVEDLNDFVALNLHALAEKEGIEVVLCNAVMVTNNKLEELEEKMKLVLKRGEEKEKELKLLREQQRKNALLLYILCFFVFCCLCCLLYIIFLLHQNK